MTDHLGLGRIAAGMDVDAIGAKSNDVDGGLDAALTNPGSFTIDATNTRTLTAAEMIGNVGFKFTADGATAACAVNVPATNAEGATLRRGFFAVINNTGHDLTVQKSGQSETAPALSDGQRSILYYDGDNVYLAVPQGSVGGDGPAGVSGTSALTRVRVVATANVDISTALENGDTLDGVTLATNDLVLLTGQTAAAENGVYVVPASGAASRHSDFDTYDEVPGTYFSVMEGTAKADTLWRCTSDRGGTIGSTAIEISEFTSGGGGGGSGWQSAGSGYTATGVWDQSVDGSVSEVVFTDLGGFTELMLYAEQVTKSASGVIHMTVSTDNGVSFYTTSGDYVVVSTSGGRTATTALGLHDGNTTAAVDGWNRILDNVEGMPKFTIGNVTSPNRSFVASSDAINAVRLYPTGGGNFTGGKIHCIGR